jgi:hypothetical protein
MLELNLDNISHAASVRIRPFFEAILEGYPKGLHSIHVTGSAITGDFNDKISDVNSLVLLDEINFEFLRFLAPLGKKYGAKGMAAPLLLTPKYIEESLDVFPVEFLDLQLIHKTVYGSDILADITIEKSYLRLQCEREIKTRLIGLKQGYLSSMGEPDKILNILSRSIRGCMPLFRAVIFLKGGKPPIEKLTALGMLENSIGIQTAPFAAALALKSEKSVNKDMVLSLFESYYTNLETVSDIVNALEQ